MDSVVENTTEPKSASDSNIWHGVHPRYRVAAGVIAAMALLPLGAVLFGDEHLPKWQQWLVVAVFTPMAVIGEWIVITGRTTIKR